MITKSTTILESLRKDNGLFRASHADVNTGYHMAWIRDNIYEAIGLEAIDPEKAIKTYHILLDILLKHEWKIDWAIKEKPQHKYQYIHARYHPDTLEEIHQEWGNMQNDAIGLLLFKIGELAEKKYLVIRNTDDLRILKKLVDYLTSIEYWHDEDNGIWENEEELHASSVGACVAGLKKISKFVQVPEELIQKGQDALNDLLPRESPKKEVDLALLSLIYPLNIATPEQRDLILENIEKHLLKEKGIIRHKGDWYYEKDGEAEWCFGLPWMAIIYKNIGNFSKYRYYILKTLNAMNDNGELPELYYANSDEYNDNTPLGWGQALFIVAMK